MRPTFFEEQLNFDCWENKVFKKLADDTGLPLEDDRMKEWWSADEAKIREMMRWFLQHPLSSSG